MKMTSKMVITYNEDNLKKEDNIKNQVIFKNEENTNMSTASTTLPEKLLMIPHLDKHSKTDYAISCLSRI